MHTSERAKELMGSHFGSEGVLLLLLVTDTFRLYSRILVVRIGWLLLFMYMHVLPSISYCYLVYKVTGGGIIVAVMFHYLRPWKLFSVSSTPLGACTCVL